MPASVLRLTHGGWVAEIAPAIGGSMLGLRYHGRPVLRASGADALAQGDSRVSASYPLVPFANRIDRGRFGFEGRAHDIGASADFEPHAIHGVGWRLPWTVEEADDRSARLALSYRPGQAASIAWPFAFDAAQTFSLGPDGLRLAGQVTNRNDGAAPLGLGFHPFFQGAPDSTLAFRAATGWANDANGLPLTATQAWDHASPRPVGAWPLDNDFTGWAGAAEIASPSLGLSIRLTADPVFGCLRVFTPAGQDFFAVEPVSHGADALNRPALPAMTRLAPGETLAGAMTIAAELI